MGGGGSGRLRRLAHPQAGRGPLESAPFLGAAMPGGLRGGPRHRGFRSHPGRRRPEGEEAGEAPQETVCVGVRVPGDSSDHLWDKGSPEARGGPPGCPPGASQRGLFPGAGRLGPGVFRGPVFREDEGAFGEVVGDRPICKDPGAHEPGERRGGGGIPSEPGGGPASERERDPCDHRRREGDSDAEGGRRGAGPREEEERGEGQQEERGLRGRELPGGASRPNAGGGSRREGRRGREEGPAPAPGQEDLWRTIPGGDEGERSHLPVVGGDGKASGPRGDGAVKRHQLLRVKATPTFTTPKGTTGPPMGGPAPNKTLSPPFAFPSPFTVAPPSVPSPSACSSAP